MITPGAPGSDEQPVRWRVGFLRVALDSSVERESGPLEHADDGRPFRLIGLDEQTPQSGRFQRAPGTGQHALFNAVNIYLYVLRCWKPEGRDHIVKRHRQHRLLVAVGCERRATKSPGLGFQLMTALAGIDAAVLEAEDTVVVGQRDRHRDNHVLTAVQLNVVAQPGEARVAGLERNHTGLAVLCRDERERPDVGADVVEHFPRLDGIAQPVRGPRFLRTRVRPPSALHGRRGANPDFALGEVDPDDVMPRGDASIVRRGDAIFVHDWLSAVYFRRTAEIRKPPNATQQNTLTHTIAHVRYQG